jgi:hypothetical protein
MNNVVPNVDKIASKGKQASFDQNKLIDAEKLHEEMKTALGDKYISMDTGQRERGKDETKIIVRATEDATEDDLKAVEAVIANHQPPAIPAEQQRTIDRAEAWKRMVAKDFVAIRKLPAAERQDAILDMLEDVQKLLQGSLNG